VSNNHTATATKQRHQREIDTAGLISEPIETHALLTANPHGGV